MPACICLTPNASVRMIDVNKDDLACAYQANLTIPLFSLENSSIIRRYEVSHQIAGIHFTHKKKHVFYAIDDSFGLHTFDTRTDTKKGSRLNPKVSSHNVVTTALSSDGKTLAVASADFKGGYHDGLRRRETPSHIVSLYDIRKPKERVASYNKHFKSYVTGMEFYSDGHDLLIGDQSGLIQMFDTTRVGEDNAFCWGRYVRGPITKVGIINEKIVYTISNKSEACVFEDSKGIVKVLYGAVSETSSQSITEVSKAYFEHPEWCLGLVKGVDDNLPVVAVHGDNSENFISLTPINQTGIREKEPVLSYIGHSGEVKCMKSIDELILTGGEDGYVVVQIADFRNSNFGDGMIHHHRLRIVDENLDASDVVDNEPTTSRVWSLPSTPPGTPPALPAKKVMKGESNGEDKTDDDDLLDSPESKDSKAPKEKAKKQEKRKSEKRQQLKREEDKTNEDKMKASEARKNPSNRTSGEAVIDDQRLTFKKGDLAELQEKGTSDGKVDENLDDSDIIDNGSKPTTSLVMDIPSTSSQSSSSPSAKKIMKNRSDGEDKNDDDDLLSALCLDLDAPESEESMAPERKEELQENGKVDENLDDSDIEDYDRKPTTPLVMDIPSTSSQKTKAKKQPATKSTKEDATDKKKEGMEKKETKDKEGVKVGERAVREAKYQEKADQNQAKEEKEKESDTKGEEQKEKEASVVVEAKDTVEKSKEVQAEKDNDVPAESSTFNAAAVLQRIFGACEIYTALQQELDILIVESDALESQSTEELTQLHKDWTLFKKECEGCDEKPELVRKAEGLINQKCFAHSILMMKRDIIVALPDVSYNTVADEFLEQIEKVLAQRLEADAMPKAPEGKEEKQEKKESVETQMPVDENLDDSDIVDYDKTLTPSLVKNIPPTSSPKTNKDKQETGIEEKKATEAKKRPATKSMKEGETDKKKKDLGKKDTKEKESAKVGELAVREAGKKGTADQKQAKEAKKKTVAKMGKTPIGKVQQRAEPEYSSEYSSSSSEDEEVKELRDYVFEDDVFDDSQYQSTVSNVKEDFETHKEECAKIRSIVRRLVRDTVMDKEPNMESIIEEENMLKHYQSCIQKRKAVASILIGQVKQGVDNGNKKYKRFESESNKLSNSIRQLEGLMQNQLYKLAEAKLYFPVVPTQSGDEPKAQNEVSLDKYVELIKEKAKAKEAAESSKEEHVEQEEQQPCTSASCYSPQAVPTRHRGDEGRVKTERKAHFRAPDSVAFNAEKEKRSEELDEGTQKAGDRKRRERNHRTMKENVAKRPKLD